MELSDIFGESNTSLILDDSDNFTTTVFPEFALDDDNRTSNSTSSSACVPHSEALFIFLVGGVGISTVCIFGIFGNILSALVLSRSSMRSSVNIILLGLSICDLTFVTVSLMFYGASSIFQYFCLLLKYNDIMLPLMVPPLFPLLSVGKTFTFYI